MHVADTYRRTRRAALRSTAALAVLAAGALALLPSTACAQGGGSAPIRLVVPYPAGGPLDAAARALAAQAQGDLGATIVVENRPGAGGNIGADLVAKAPPDGRTLVIGAVATHAINPWLYAKMPYDWKRDFTPITRVAVVPNVLVMSTERADALGIRTLADFVRVARARPGTLNYGSGGNGSAGHLVAEMFKAATGIYAVHIPYAGGAPAQLALLAGQVDFNIDNLATAAANIRAGKLRALAVTSAARSPALPDVPTMAEAGAAFGLKDLDVTTWFGVFGPAGLPADVTQRLYAAFAAALRSEPLRTRLAPMLAEPAPLAPDAFAAFVARENARYGPIVRRSGAIAQ